MSVLFQALNRAARDHADRRIASGLPFLALSDKQTLSPKIWACGLLLLGFCLGAGVFYFCPHDEVLVQGTQQKLPAASSDVSPDLADGIKLSGESLRNEITEKDTQAIADKIKDLPQGAYVKNDKPAIMIKEAEDDSEEIAEAEKLLAAGKYKQASGLYQGLYSRNKSNGSLAANYVAALAGVGAKNSKAEMRKILKEHPENPSILATLSKAISDEAPLEAKEYLEKAAQLDPANNFYQLGLGVLCDRLGQNEKALQFYRQAIAQRPEGGAPSSVSWEAVEQRVKYLEGN